MAKDDGSGNDISIGPFSYDVPDKDETVVPEGSENDIRIGRLGYDTPDNLDEVHRDLKFAQNLGEFATTHELGKLTSALSPTIGPLKTGPIVNGLLTDLGLKKLKIGDVSKEIGNASEEVSKNVSTIQKTAKGMNEAISNGIANVRMAVAVVDFVSKTLFGFSIVDEWVKKPFFGDWDELEKTAAKWDALASSLTGVQTAIQNMSSNVNEESWCGCAADMFKERNDAVGEVAGEGCAPCTEMSQALNALAENAQNAFDLILDTIDEIISLLKIISGELIVPGAGPVLVAVTCAAEVTQAIQWANDITTCLNNLYTAFSGFSSCISTMQQLVSKSEGVKATFGSGSGSGSGSNGGFTPAGRDGTVVFA
ncbi:hypothetical protein [Bifidobacterium saguinibicoloris]|uniref:hypothetical protein n=1 Tax=Bifidobacterium saguinibicoloris TaxID=2834433 RepID=UPI001C57AB1F|nr:hypothetical protein [Bifidobacterium saguinibicoloris]MBW3081124.1 hypothetical protein [Bifidobacterium saguinibicoloris]